MKNFISGQAVLAIFCAILFVPSLSNAQFMRSYTTGSQHNVGKGDMVLNDQSSGYDLAICFGETTDFRVDILKDDTGLEPTNCTTGTSAPDYVFTATSNNYYPRQVLESEIIHTTKQIRFTVVGETDAGNISGGTCGTKNGFISSVYESGCAVPGSLGVTITTVFGIAGHKIDMRDAWEDVGAKEVFFTGVATECATSTKRLFIGKLDNSTSTGVLTVRVLTITDALSLEVQFQSKAIVADDDNIYVGGTYKGWPADGFMLAIDRDALLATGAPAAPTTILKTLFDDGGGDQSAIQDLVYHDGHIYAVGQDNNTFDGISNANGFIMSFEPDLDIVSTYIYEKEGSNTAEGFKGISHVKDGQFYVSGHTDGYSADQDIVAVEFIGKNGEIFPQYIKPQDSKNAHLYKRTGTDINLNIINCNSGSHVTLFSQFHDGDRNVQYVIHPENDLTIASTCYLQIEMDISHLCSGVSNNEVVNTSHEDMADDIDITITREAVDRGTQVCAATEGSAPNEENDATGTREFTNSKGDMPISIYPNPGSGVYNVQSEEEIQIIRVYSNNGQLVKEVNAMTKQTQVDLQEFKSGHYLIKIITDSGSYNSTVIKE